MSISKMLIRGSTNTMMTFSASKTAYSIMMKCKCPCYMTR
ncbi:MAG TPA: hypothetical protein [Caudoviricetes sp.]|nr:MAG TPA: hypothetical protein [Caudoviricetes sp.]